MSHDVKKYKILKKIIGGLGYKLVDKNSIKSDRIINQKTYNVSDFLRKLFKENKLKKVIQIGSNDGSSDDFLKKCINKNTSAILIEPIENAFIKLKKNYQDFEKIIFLNIAIDTENNKKEIFYVNERFYPYYEKKYKDKNVDWLNVLASFNKANLISHGIKIECKKISTLINLYKYEDLDLLLIDTEGYDAILVDDFLSSTKLKPLIIFEWIHIEYIKLDQLLTKLKQMNYNILKIDKDLICFQENSFTI
jgi:FkbM family methyltransferase